MKALSATIRLQKGATLRQNREAHADEALKGNKARQLEQIRKEERERLNTQLELPFGDRTLDPEDQPFSEKHGWEATRYAGVFYLPDYFDPPQ